jgi:hypothetical protein
VALLRFFAQAAPKIWLQAAFIILSLNPIDAPLTLSTD